MRFLVVTGMSGAGKTTVTGVLEDLGYYCVDNLPTSLIPTFVKTYTELPRRREAVALVCDVRSESDFLSLEEQIRALKEKGHPFSVLFLDCEDRVLLNRYKETRHRHPLTALYELSTSEALKRERAMLSPLRQSADRTIDTTQLTPTQLREAVLALYGGKEQGGLLVSCLSFGFKYGIAVDADLVFDVRCFPNPFYEPALRPLTGLEDSVKEYVLSKDEVKLFLTKLCDLILFLLPQYQAEGKTQLTVAFGCTGGKHRSVAIAEALTAFLKSKGYRAVTAHRDIEK